jgi:hypothetical protein
MYQELRARYGYDLQRCKVVGGRSRLARKVFMTSGRSIYTVKLKSHLDAGWLKRLPARSMAIAYEGDVPVTTFTLDVIDQAELIGVLSELHGLGMRLLSVIFEADEPQHVVQPGVPVGHS